jgi:hypothetical protein
MSSRSNARRRTGAQDHQTKDKWPATANIVVSGPCKEGRGGGACYPPRKGAAYCDRRCTCAPAVRPCS